MIPTSLQHGDACTQTKRLQRDASGAMVVYRCPECGAAATSTRSA